MDGWKCPTCGRVFAPFVSECKYCNAQNEPAYVPTYIPRTTPTWPEERWWEKIEVTC